jgi:hypothetical protein
VAGFVPSAATGVLLFCVDPLRYYGNVLFRVKLTLLAVAGCNALVFHWARAGRSDDDPRVSLVARRAGQLV